MQWKLELVPVPVTDVDRARDFYVEQVGFTLDHDVSPGGGLRIVQITPPGSGCSILVSTGVTTAAPGSAQGLHLVVDDVDEAREHLVARGVEVGETIDYPPRREGGDHVRYVHFSDPDGNTWAVQEIRRGG